MEELFLDILNKLGAMNDISLVDEDYGQLETAEDTYPVTFPAILVEAPTVEWSELGQYSQIGRVTLRVRLVIDCYHDTHYGSTQEEEASAHIRLYDKMHRQLQGFRPSTATALVRETTRFYTIAHGIKCYESIYSCEVKDVINETTVEPVSVSPVVGVHFEHWDE